MPDFYTEEIKIFIMYMLVLCKISDPIYIIITKYNEIKYKQIYVNIKYQDFNNQTKVRADMLPYKQYGTILKCGLPMVSK